LSLSSKSSDDKATLKQIVQQKHKATWGDIPPLFQQIASSAADVNGLFKQGFDDALKQLLNRRNWNSDRLLDPITRKLNKPRLAVYQLFTDWGFEVHCFPYLDEQEVDEYQRLNPAMEFMLWDPSTMRRLIQIRHLREFIEYTHQSGDAIDKALLGFTNSAVIKVIRLLAQEFTITKVEGISIPSYIKLAIERDGYYPLENLPLHVLKRLGSNTLHLLRQAERLHVARTNAETKHVAETKEVKEVKEAK
jgi:hypothetical protein